MGAIMSVNDLQLDNTVKLIPATDTDPEYYESDNTIVKSQFYPTGNKVVFERNGRKFTWTPQEMKYVDSFGMEDTIYTVQDAPLEAKANYVRFNRSMPDIDDWFTVDNSELKHSILVQGFQRDPLPFLSAPIDFCVGGQVEYDTDLKVFADGIEQAGTFETAGEITFQDSDGNTVFNLPKVVAYDSKIPERAVTDGKYRVVNNGGGMLGFQFVLDNAWISDISRIYPIVIDPTVVVNSAYDTSGNGGRKLVKLSNGILYAITKNTSTNWIYAYKSSDNGSTWISAGSTNIGSAFDVSIVAMPDNTVGILYAYSAGGVNFSKTDTALTVIINTIQTVDSGQTTVGNCSLAINSAGTELHAAWASKNSTYPNSFNIRYKKGTINADGSVTWGSVVQVSTINSYTYAFENPCVVVKDNQPYIFMQQTGSSAIYVYSPALSGQKNTSIIAGNTQVISVGTGYTQFNPCAVVDSNGVIHVVWHGTDATDTAKNNIRYSKSIDGGLTWSAMTKLTSGNTNNQDYASIIIDKNNKIYVFYENAGTSYQLRRITSTDAGASWSGAAFLISNLTGNPFPSAMSSDNLVAWIWKDTSSVMFDYFRLNSAPNAPTLSTRSNFDSTASATFSWTFSDPDSGNTQSAYQLLIKRVSDGVTVFDSGKVASTTPSHTLPANTLSNNAQYQWQVRTYDNNDAVGPYSSLATFYTSAKPSVSITTPATDGTTLAQSSITVEWSFSDPESEGQSAYQVKLTDNADYVLWDSGKVTDSSARSRTVNYTLANSTSYKAKLTVWDAKDVASTETVRTFSTSFTVPATPTITTTADNGFIALSISNPTPSGGQPTVTSNDIYRRISGETAWTRIATGTTYNDYAVASGVIYEYKTTANGDNLTTADSATVTASITLNGVWLHDVADPQGTAYNFKLDGQERGSSWKADVTMLQFAGRTRPVAEFGESGEGTVSVALQMLRDGVDLAKLDSLVKRNGTVCYRDGRGRRTFGVISSMPIKDEVWGYSVTVEIMEISYDESI